MAGQHTWRERVSALRYVPPLIRLVWQTHRGFTVAMVVLRLVRAFVPSPRSGSGSSSSMPSSRCAHTAARPRAAVAGSSALEIAIVLVGEVLARASALVESLLGDLFSNHTSVRLMEHAATLDLDQFEDPDVLRPARARAAADDRRASGC